MTEWTWKRSPRKFNNVDPQPVGEKLMQLHEKHGGVTTELVVKEGKKKTSPLHEAFEWVDTVAAHQYRLSQARELIRCCVEVVISEDTEAQTTREVFIHVPGEGDELPRYATIESLAKDPGGYMRALGELYSHIDRVQGSIARLRWAAEEAHIDTSKIDVVADHTAAVLSAVEELRA